MTERGYEQQVNPIEVKKTYYSTSQNRVKRASRTFHLKHPPRPALSDVVIQLVKLLDFNVISPTCLNPLSPFRLLVYQFTELILSTLLCVHRVVTEISIMTMV